MASIIPYIPETITVHLGAPGEDAANVTVSFPDYIKNVASSEIYPTWEPSAIRANILAQISFALNRVYTEYYPSRGYDFDITNTTAYDQRYVDGRNIFENISQMVDELFSTYIRRRGTLEPLPARFCNGTTVTCSGMSQWGSQALAQQGLNSLEILRTYYGEDIELVVGAPVLPLVRSYPGTPLNRGDRSGYVQLLQQMLNRISLNYPSIPQLNPDGIYGALTEQAVRQFQDIFGLEPDGIVGQATWYAVVRLYVAVTRLTELYTEGINLESLSFDFFAPLSLGEYGPKVQQVRYMLAVVGQFIEEVPPIEVGTVYDQDTVQAVEAFQRYDGLPVTGVVDQTTWNELYQQYVGIQNTVPLSQVAEEPEERYPGQPLMVGDRDEREAVS